MNVNDNVWVRLTQAGKKTYTDTGRDFTYKTLDSLGYIRFQMWELMQIFGGDKLNMLSPVPFERNEMFFESPGAKTAMEGLILSDESPLATEVVD